jgi:hypothetical protein
MWVLFARAPLPDVHSWPGRRALAAVDAVLWPAGGAIFTVSANMSDGVIGQFVLAMCALLAASRLFSAIVRNHRYRFTTWSWARYLCLLVAVGYALILSASLV